MKKATQILLVMVLAIMAFYSTSVKAEYVSMLPDGWERMSLDELNYQSLQIQDYSIVIRYHFKNKHPLGTPEILRESDLLASHALNVFLLNEDYVLASGDRPYFLITTNQSIKVLDEEKKSQLREALIARFIDNIDPEYPLSGIDWESLKHALHMMKSSRDEQARVALSWVSASDQWKQTPPRALSILILVLHNGGFSFDDLQVMKDIRTIIVDDYLGNAAYMTGELNYTETLQAVYLILRSLTDEQKTKVQDQVVNRFVRDRATVSTLSDEDVKLLMLILRRGTVTDAVKVEAVESWHKASDRWKTATPNTLAQVIAVLERSQSTYRRTFYPQLCSEMVNRAINWEDMGEVIAGQKASFYDINSWAISMLACIAVEQSNRDILLQALEGPDGDFRVPLAILLARGHHLGGDLERWKKLVEQKCNDTTASANTRAGWLMASAFSDADWEASGKSLNWAVKDELIEEVLTTTQSEELKLVCTEILVDGYSRGGSFDMARAMLSSIETQLPSKRSATRMAHMRQKIANQETRSTRQASEAVKRSMIDYKKELQRRLAEAQEQGDSARVRYYQDLLSR